MTLRLDGAGASWSIVAWVHGWRCTVPRPKTITATSCNTHTRQASNASGAEIDAARGEANVAEVPGVE